MARNYSDVKQSGTLNKRLHFQQLGGTPNAGGELTQWIDYVVLWGSVDVLQTALLYNTGEFMAKSTYNIVVRYNPSVLISVQNRIVCEGETFVIEAIVDKGFKHRELQLLCYVNNQVS
jgi:SPP1 family predicted phage head-tail adaptor